MRRSKSNETLERSPLRAVLGVVSTRVVLLVLGLMVSVIVARALGPAGRGAYAVVVALASTTLALGHLSVEQAQVYLTSQGIARRQLAANAVVLGGALGIVAAACILTVSFLTGYPADDVKSLALVPIALAAVPFGIVSAYATGLVVLAGRTDVVNRAMLLGGGTQSVLLLGLAVVERLTVVAVIIVWSLQTALPLVVLLWYLRPRPRSFSWRVARNEVMLGLRYHGGLLSLYLLLRVDVLMLAAFTSNREVGLYALAVTIIELVNIGTDAIATVVLRRQASSPLADAGSFTARVVGLAFILVLGTVGALLVVSPWLVPLVYGDAFTDSVPALLALAPGVIALAASRSAGGYILRLNRPWTVTALAASALSVNVGLNLVLIPAYGIVGAGLASSLAYVLLAASYVLWLRRSADLAWSDFSPLPVLRHHLRRLGLRRTQGH